ncbi:MAG: valine--tRNA ligase [Patescibacteria group bacterium]|nr:valine--tRNA ligase [Patescibacteria group bacterium]MCL5224464.1 valine--tRNA ligase [Patescibacteria group bacterium]
MVDQLSPQYNPKDTEEEIYKLWEKSGFFNPDKLPQAKHRQPYTIIMPPPNANAPLHLGHALFVTIEDIIIRYQRMRGRRALWLPGTDHAGFETQVVFEKKLEKERRSRFQMQREEFYKEAWDFVQRNKHITEEGLRRLGASCDWSRNTFTLDPEVVKIVYATFKQMYEDGLVYRGNRIGNWCTKHQTALSDLETKYEEREDPLYYIKYGPITLATVRPETKFGDTAVAVNPANKRYEKYIGQEIEVDTLLGKKKMKVIGDEAVDMAFGTGAVKVTPAHDATDFDIWQRHQDEIPGPIQIIDRRGRLTEAAGLYAGLKVAEAREKVVEDMSKRGLIEKIDQHYKHNVQLCYKCGTVIEPLIIPQWYVTMTKPLPDGRPSLRDMAVKAINDGDVKILTERFEKIFMHWMEGIKDWPISRQIWWGIPIPVKYCKDCGAIIVDTENKVTSCKQCSSKHIEADPDTFDTWFSSGQWPFATLQARGKKDFETYFPTQVMETAADILFFWVARMIMLSYYRTGKEPFQYVYLHGLVRDKDRQKMSKSKGNVVDPLGVIELYGTDALRFALIFSTAAGNDIPLAEDKIRGMKYFVNKLWNITRYILSNVEAKDFSKTNTAPQPKTDVDREILDGLTRVAERVTDNLDNFMFHQAAQEIYQFVWHELADKYIEASKPQLQDQATAPNTRLILAYLLQKILILLHPFTPFVTEAIWRKLPNRKNLLIVEKW